jgi:putative phosphoribosyl transferase
MINREVQIDVKNVSLKANLQIPVNAAGLVIFAHGSGSSRLSLRNNYVADLLNKQGMATLLTDLLTPAEDETYNNRFNIPLLSSRLVKVTEWAATYTSLQGLPIGYFGASTGAASALQAAAVLGNSIRAVVSRGGRPDLAAGLDKVKSPVLLIVGSLDTHVIELNKQAYLSLQCQKQFSIVEGASHLFEEPGKLMEAANLAIDWFEQYLLIPGHILKKLVKT